jgi:V/A-type H+-transporting ATPase subunit E
MNTNDKIKKLTDKIYLEGIEEAKREADQIMAKANKEAEEIIKSAKLKAVEITEQIQKKAVELKKNTDSELRLAARQFTSTLKQEIAKEIVTAQVEATVHEAFTDKDFSQNMILSMINKWNPENSESMSISLLLPKNEEVELNEFFNNKANGILNSGLEINFLPTIKKGFKIAPNGSNYHINFTDESFENYFKHYLKEKTKKLIFD